MERMGVMKVRGVRGESHLNPQDPETTKPPKLEARIESEVKMGIEIEIDEGRLGRIEIGNGERGLEVEIDIRLLGDVDPDLDPADEVTVTENEIGIDDEVAQEDDLLPVIVTEKEIEIEETVAAQDGTEVGIGTVGIDHLKEEKSRKSRDLHRPNLPKRNVIDVPFSSCN